MKTTEEYFNLSYTELQKTKYESYTKEECILLDASERTHFIYDAADLEGQKKYLESTGYDIDEVLKMTDGRYTLLTTYNPDKIDMKQEMTSEDIFPVEMSLDEFWGINDCSFSTSGYSLDKCRFPHGRTERQKSRDLKACIEANRAYSDKRQECREMYSKLVDEGKIIPLSLEKKLIMIANGHPDNEKVQAARRTCDKRGFDWKCGIIDDANMLYNKPSEAYRIENLKERLERKEEPVLKIGTQCPKRRIR